LSPAAVILYLGAILLFLIGLMESAAFLMLIVQGFRLKATAPILAGIYGEEIVPGVTHVVDPIVQALTLTSIVIGVATLALALALIILLARHTGSLDVRRLNRLRG
jgi:multicomponent Na+:H+ antiporter subunit C